jgi:hypothetical protein
VFPDRNQIVGKNQHKKIKYQFKSEVAPLLCVPAAFFFFSFSFSIFCFLHTFLFFVFIFSIFFCYLGAHKKEAHKISLQMDASSGLQKIWKMWWKIKIQLWVRDLCLNFGILIFAQPVSRTHGWKQNLILPDFKKEITLFWVRMQKLWPFEVRRSELGFWRGVAARVFTMER